MPESSQTKFSKRRFSEAGWGTIAGWSTAVAAIALYWPTLNYPLLHFDDDVYVTVNAAARGFTVDHLRAAFTQVFNGNYAPLHILSYMLDYSLWGSNAVGYHLSNVILHAIAAASVLLLVRRLDGRWWIAVAAGMVFAVHPVQVETVAWVSERKSIVAAVLFFLSFLLFDRFLKSGNRPAWIGSLVCFALSCLAKVSAITAPLIYLGYLYTYHRSLFRSRWPFTIPFFAMAGVFSIVAVYAQRTAGGLENYYGGGIFGNALTMIVGIAQYIRLLLFPTNMAALYYFSFNRPGDSTVLISTVVVSAALAGAVFLWRRDRRLGFWAFWFFVVLLPNLQIIPLKAVIADRYLYLPLIGPAVLIGNALEFVWKGRDGHRRVCVAASSIGVIALCLLTLAREPLWKSDRGLWIDSLSKSPSAMGFIFLGDDYQRDNDWAEAEEKYRQAIAMSPGLAAAYGKVGYVRQRRGDIHGAIEYYRESLRLDPRPIPVYQVLIQTLSAVGRLSEAEQVARRALERDPGSRGLLLSLARVLEGMGDRKGASDIYERILSGAPDHVIALNNLAMILIEDPGASGERALDLAQRAAAKAPGDPIVLDTLAWVYFRLGRIAEAERVMNEAFKAPAGDPILYFHAAEIDLASGKTDRARERLKRYLDEKPDASKDPPVRALQKRLEGR